MDYEEKYKIAFKRFKAWREKYLTKETAFGDVIYDKTGEMQAEFNAIFPELTESEDERIRKGIIAHIQGHLDTQDDFTRRQATGPFSSEEVKFFMDALAWLEKQKEQKPVEIDEEINRWMGCEAFPEGTNITPLPQAMEIVERTAKHFFELGEKTVPCPGGYWEGFRHGVRECQNKIRDVKDTIKEQKPTEWSEEDELMILTIIQTLETLGGRGTTGMQIDWLKSLRPQPKPEWSEEDRRTIDRACVALRAYANGELPEFLPSELIGYADRLQSLRPQPIQLKEAYKEGFQTARHATALAFMNYCDKIRPNGKMCLSNGECEEIEKAFLVGDWEKIERYFHKYHWKPSEEQMYSLGTVVKGYDECTVGSVGYNLKELYEHLKKLM